ncbi:hypothetical protein [Pandoraea sp. ISTKB]
MLDDPKVRAAYLGESAE